MSTPAHDGVLSRGSWFEWQRINELLRTELIGGVLLLIAALAAITFANTGAADFYFGLRDAHIGHNLGSLHLDLSVGHWAADGLLAVFFFMAGLELKQEFVAGDLRNPRRAIVPVAAAFGGVAAPAIIFALINSATGDALKGWAIPTATDIAFALAVLAVIGSALPTAMRTFLLTLAIVDDLIAIVIIAVFYTTSLNFAFLAGSLVIVAIYGILARKLEDWFRCHLWASWFILLPIGIVAWALLLNSGIHATIAGVLLAFTLPVHPITGDGDRHDGLAHMMEHHLRPFSAGFCVPVFAFFSAGVAVGGWDGLSESIAHPVALGIIAGLVGGKMIGIWGTTFIATRFKGVELDSDVKWIDVLGLAAIGGVGFTVSLLVNELSFGTDELGSVGKVGILAASLLAALVASAILVPRNRHYQKIAAAEAVDVDEDSIPDVFERPEDIGPAPVKGN